MAYSKQNFQDGQILTAANLEKMENGIIAGQGAHNLLDNSDFTNPVNQRGQTSYTGAGYTIDRWKAGVSVCLMYVKAGQSVAFNTKTEGVNAYWRQYLPHSLSQLEGKTFTLAIKDTWGNTHCATGVYPSSAPSDTKSVIWLNMYANVSIVLYCATDGTAFVQLSTKKSVPIVWVALYEGSYTADTLPAYQPKGYAAELAECQRYARIRNAENYAIAILGAEKVFTIEHPGMRITPTVQVINPITNAVGSIASYSTGGEFQAVILSITKDRTNIKLESGTPGNTYIYAYNINADL